MWVKTIQNNTRKKQVMRIIKNKIHKIMMNNCNNTRNQYWKMMKMM